MNSQKLKIKFKATESSLSADTPLRRIRNYVRTNLVGTITVTIAGSLLLTGLSNWNVWKIYQGFESTVSKQFELERISKDLIYLDEWLTMSAKMAVSTGDVQWEARYNKVVPQNDAALKRLKENIPPQLVAEQNQTDVSATKLIEMENRAFKLVRQSKAKEAFEILAGKEYTDQKKIYSEVNDRVLAKVEASIKGELQNYQQQLLLSILFAGATLPVLIGGWLLVLSAVRDYIRDRQAAQASLTASQEKLYHSNKQLAEEVEIRTNQEQQIRSESEILQADISHILDIVSSIEGGDLTIQADVNQRMTGLVSDTLNRTIESLDRIVSAVVQTTHTVTEDASQLESAALETARQAQFQTAEIQAVQSLMDRVNSLTTKSLEYGIATETAVNLAISAVTTGKQAIEDTIGGIGTLRAGTDQIVKRTELLNEFVELAAQFSKDQKRVASLTRVLALNASMLSSRAVKEQNPDRFSSLAKEFETIARQVNDLATDTNQSLVSLQQRTNRIQTVTSGLSQDITDINQLVQKFTTEIGKSGRAFNSIQTAISQTSELDEKVHDSNQNIAQAVRDTLIAIESIASVTQVNETKAILIREQVQSMGDLSRKLLKMVEFFKLNTTEPQFIDPDSLDETTHQLIYNS